MRLELESSALPIAAVHQEICLPWVPFMGGQRGRQTPLTPASEDIHCSVKWQSPARSCQSYASRHKLRDIDPEVWAPKSPLCLILLLMTLLGWFPNLQY